MIPTSPFKTYLGLGDWKNLTGSTSGADLGQADRKVGLDTGNHVKVSARVYRPCAAPVTVRLASRVRLSAVHVGDPPSVLPEAYKLNSVYKYTHVSNSSCINIYI